MALVPSVTVSNNSVSTNTFTLVDTSTGSDGAIASRQIFIYLVDNSQAAGSPVSFPLSAGSSISPSILTQDFAYSITVNWLDGSGNALYTFSIIGVFTGFLEWFYYGLVQSIAAQSNIQNDQVFTTNLGRLRTYIDSANQSISIGGSIYNAQNMILLAQQLQQNSTLYF